MSSTVQLTRTESHAAIIERVVLNGDLSVLSAEERISYYAKVCESVGLNPLTKPFEFIKLNGKLTLYALKGASYELSSNRKLSVTIVSREKEGDIFVVTAKVKDPAGREGDDIGCVSIGGLKGENLANAMMKAVTKAKRRAILSFCGLGMLDETEVETIPNAERIEPRAVEAKPTPAPVTTKTQKIVQRLRQAADPREVIANIDSAKTMEELTAAAESAKKLDEGHLEMARKVYREKLAQLAGAEPAHVTVDAAVAYEDDGVAP